MEHTDAIQRFRCGSLQASHPYQGQQIYKCSLGGHLGRRPSRGTRMPLYAPPAAHQQCKMVGGSSRVGARCCSSSSHFPLWREDWEWSTLSSCPLPHWHFAPRGSQSKEPVVEPAYTLPLLQSLGTCLLFDASLPSFPGRKCGQDTECLPHHHFCLLELANHSRWTPGSMAEAALPLLCCLSLARKAAKK